MFLGSGGMCWKTQALLSTPPPPPESLPSHLWREMLLQPRPQVMPGPVKMRGLAQPKRTPGCWAQP